MTNGTTRRALITRAALLAAGGTTLFLLRDRLPWPPLQPRFAGGRATPWLPLPAPGGLIEIDVSVNGTPIRAVVDSGAQVSAIDRGLEERLALPHTVAAPILAYGVGGKPQLAHTVHLDLSLPGLAIAGVRAAALDLASIAKVTGRDFQLLVGRDVLRRLVVEVDFPRGRARFHPAGTWRVPHGAMTIPLANPGGAPTAPVQIDEAAPIQVLVDTGSSSGLALSETAARQAGLLALGRPVSRAHSVSLGGLSLDQVVRAHRVRVGPVTARGVDVQIYAPGAHTAAPSGLLGAGLLGRFHMVLDLDAGRLYLFTPDVIVVPGRPEQTR